MLKYLLPIYTVFSGENTWREFLLAVRIFIFSNETKRSVAQFEHDFARFVGRRNATGFGSGRMALFAILKALKIGPGDEVILQAFTCNVVPRAIRAAGAIPIYVDIDPVTFNMSADGLVKAITTRTRAVIVQHTFGIPPDVLGLKKALKGANVMVVEDCAHAFKPLPVGTLSDVYGFSFFSTDHTKPLNTHVGGIACTDSEVYGKRIATIAADANHLGFFARKRLQLSFLLEFIGHRPRLYPILRFGLAVLIRMRAPFIWQDHHDIAGTGAHSGLFRMTSFQAKLGLSQLHQIESNMAHRCAVFSRLEQSLGWYGVSEAYPVLRYAMTVKNRDSFNNSLKKGMTSSTWFDSPISGGPSIYHDVSYHLGQCPVAEYVSEHVVNIHISKKIPETVFEQFDGCRADILPIAKVETPRR